MRKNDIIEAQIINLSHEGRGIAKIDGKTVFIDNALPNEVVKARITRVRNRFNEATAIEIITASPHRVTPKCSVFGICGGCSLQHIDANAQIQFKQTALLEQLQHIGGVTPAEILPPLTGPTWAYRNKARLGVRYVNKKQRLLVGFRERQGRYLTDMHHCDILIPQVGEQLVSLSNCVESLESYQHIAQIEIAAGDQHVALIFRNLKPLSETDQQRLIEYAKTHQFHIYLQPKGPDSIYKLFPDDNQQYLQYHIAKHNLTMTFHPSDFTQINMDINVNMIEQTLTLLSLEKTDRVLDLFCGLGNFSLPIAKHCQHVTAVEGSELMVERGQHNASNNHITNIHFYAANLIEENTNQPWFKQQYDKLLLDPPRSGAQEIIEQLASHQFSSIVYVSCNPTTLARDSSLLAQQGYQLLKAGVMDMFPHTRHVESIALFQRN